MIVILLAFIAITFGLAVYSFILSGKKITTVSYEMGKSDLSGDGQQVVVVNEGNAAILEDEIDSLNADIAILKGNYSSVQLKLDAVSADNVLLREKLMMIQNQYEEIQKEMAVLASQSRVPEKTNGTLHENNLTAEIISLPETKASPEDIVRDVVCEEPVKKSDQTLTVPTDNVESMDNSGTDNDVIEKDDTKDSAWKFNEHDDGNMVEKEEIIDIFEEDNDHGDEQK